MPVSVLQIEVQDEDFKKFVNRFDEYNASVAELPGRWGEVSEALVHQNTHLEAMVASLSAIETHTAATVEHQVRFARTTEASGRSMSGLVRSTKDVAHNIKEATLSLLKWATVTEVLGGLLGAGGLWGIDRMAQSAGSKYRTATGMGVSTGEADALRINYSRYLNTDNLLSNIADAKADYSKRWIFSAMGVGQGELDHEDPASLATDVMARAKRMYLASDRSQQFIQAHGLDQLFSQEDLRRMADGDLDKSHAGYNSDRAALTMPPQVLKSWQDFDVQMQRAGTRIERVFISGLIPLEGPLEKLSVAFTTAVEALLASPRIKEWIVDLGKGLEWLAAYLTGPQIVADWHHFEDAIVRVWHALERVWAWLDGRLKFLSVGSSGDAVVGQVAGEGPGNDPNTIVNGEKLAWFAQHPEVLPPAAQSDPVGWYAAHPAAIPKGMSGSNAPYNAPVDSAQWHRERFEVPNPTLGDDYRVWARAHGLRITGADGQGRQVTDPFYDAATDPARRDEFVNQETKYFLPQGLLANMYMLESSQGRNPGTSAAGAKGDFQFMDGTAKDYPGGQSLDPQVGANAAGAYLSSLIQRYNRNVTEALAAYNWGPANVDEDLRVHKADWRKFLPAETRHYIDYAQRGLGPFREAGVRAQPMPPIKVNVDVQNQAGANVAVTGSQLAGGPR